MDERIWTPYCGAAPAPAGWLARWNLDPVLIVAMGLAFALLWRGRTREQRLMLAAALGVLAVSFISPLCALSSALFTARTLHHLLLILVAAPLLALALAAPKRSRLLPAAALHLIVLWAWHAPGAYAAALSNDATYWVMQASLLATAIWFWSAVRVASAPAAIAGLLAVMLGMGLLGALIAFAGQPIYAPHFATTLAWGLTPLEDQQAAGLIMWAPAAAVYLVVALWRMARLLTPRAEAVA